MSFLPRPRRLALAAGGSLALLALAPRARAQCLELDPALLGPGVGVTGNSSASVLALHVWEAPTGPELLVGGYFDRVVGTDGVPLPVRNSARWNGASWSRFDDTTGMVRCFGLFDAGLGDGPELYVGGDFGIRRWSPLVQQWLAPGAPPACCVYDLAVYDEGAGPRLFVAGGFTSDLAGTISPRIARWDGGHWSPVGGGFDTSHFLRTIEVFDAGQGAELYAGGDVVTAGGQPVRGLARWDGSSWRDVGGGLDPVGFTPTVFDLAVHDDGTGPALYAIGRFQSVGGVPAQNVARWDGSSWSALGSGLVLDQFVLYGSDLISFDDGYGPALYASGLFHQAGGASAIGIARWDGQAWSPVGSQPGGLLAAGGTVFRMGAFDPHDGLGPRLFFGGGGFTSVGGQPAQGIFALRRTGGPLCPGGTGTPLCFGDGSGTLCPCGTSAAGHGCPSSLVAAGARLDGSGDPASRAVLLTGTDLPPTTTVLLLRSTTASSPPGGVVFGDGLLCLGVPLERLVARAAQAGAVQFPLVHEAGAGTFRYQLVYRNADPTYCDPAADLNSSNAFAIRYP